MPEIHPSASLDRDVELADDVVIGPHCVIRGRVRIGAGTQLLGHVYLQGPLELGARNRLWPFVALGFAPQLLSWDPDRPGAGLAIGDENQFRESVTISRAASDEVPTRVGSRNYWMANSHAGHDSQIGNGCVIANGSLLGGSVRLGDGVVTGGNSAVHQFCQVGRGALLSGVVGLSKDLPPFFMLTGTNIAGSLNMIGMRRSGMPHDQIDDVRWVYKVLYRRGLSPPRATAELEQRKERPIVAEYLAFLAGSKRGLCPARGDARRGVSSDSSDPAV
jgi:UDP-N-acetylglucosamine acyltransferase